MNVQRRERARILQHNSRSIREVESRARESRQWIGRRADDPITVHPEVNVKNPPVLEPDQLMLAATFDGSDMPAAQGTKGATPQSTPQRGVEHPRAHERLRLDRSAQQADGSFDFGKFGHRRVALFVLTRVARVSEVDTMSSRAQSQTNPGVDARTPAVRRVLLYVLLLNAFVVLVKLVVGFRTGSLTVLGAALESGLDTLNNVIGMLLVSIAARAPDEDHPYGHDKFETLGALGIVGFLSISCFELLREGVTALVGGGALKHSTPIDTSIVIATLLVNSFVVWYERRRGMALGSAFLLADAEHTRGDILVTLLAVISLALGRHGGRRVDAALAITVALIIALSGWRILQRSIPILVDRRAVQADDLRRIIQGIQGIADVRGIRSRYTASGLLFAELTITVPGSTPVDVAHALADRVEDAVTSTYGAAEVTVHVEPA